VESVGCCSTSLTTAVVRDDESALRDEVANARKCVSNEGDVAQRTNGHDCNDLWTVAHRLGLSGEIPKNSQHASNPSPDN